MLPTSLRRVCRLVLVVAATLNLTGCGSSDENAESNAPGEFEIFGSWSGQLTQQGLAPFEVEATIGSLDDPSQNTVTYTGIDCGGNWTYEGREGDAFRFRELIDRGGGGDCKGSGQVLLSPVSANTVSYRFDGGGVESTGELERG